MLPVLKRNSPLLAYGYLSLAIAATVTLVIGVIFLLLMIPLSAYSVEVTQADNVQILNIIAHIFKDGGFYAYQLGMAIWGFGGLLMCLALLNIHQTHSLVPKWILVWGMIGYLIFIAGTMFEVFGFEYGMI